MVIWRAGANGQLGRRNLDKKYANIIGQQTFQNAAEKGNGQRLMAEFAQNNLIPMNTWKYISQQLERKKLSDTNRAMRKKY